MPKLKSLSGSRGKKTTPKEALRPVSSDNELRGKLSALPPIGGMEPTTYNQWKKL